jgi:guanine deaminase
MHFNEAEYEIRLTRESCPHLAAKREADLYNHFGLLSSRSVPRHCIIILGYDKDMIKDKQRGVAHSVIINISAGGGFMAAPVRDSLRRGTKVGLGTYSSGG